MNIIIDLDGVIWLSEDPISGSADAVERLRDAGHRLLFVTNNSNPTVEELLDKLRDSGVVAEREELVTSSQAAASLLEPGTTALVCGGPGVAEAPLEGADRIPAVVIHATITTRQTELSQVYCSMRQRAPIGFFHRGRAILGYVAQLKSVDVTGVEPMAHPLPLKNVLREDVVRPSLSVEQVLANAPAKDGDYFAVPKVLDTGMGGG